MTPATGTQTKSAHANHTYAVTKVVMVTTVRSTGEGGEAVIGLGTTFCESEEAPVELCESV